MKTTFLVLGIMGSLHSQQRRHEEEQYQRRAAAHRREEDRRRQEKIHRDERDAFEQQTSISIPNQDSPTYFADLLKQCEKAQNPNLPYRFFSQDPQVQNKKTFYTRCLVEDTQDNIDLTNETRVNMRRFIHS